ncbi:MAG: epimerase [Dehalococcoidia bacterium]|nr:epimerase [Dehalococcoidia bacterium]
MNKLRSILVTGGAGFVGSHLIERLLSRGRMIVCLDNFTNESYSADFKRQNVVLFRGQPNFTLIEGDLRNQTFLDKVFSEHHFESVVHLAGMAGVRLSVEKPYLYDESNIWATINLLEECRKTPPERFVLASSSSVYGNDNQVPFCENQLPHPVSPYGASKAAAELFCQAYYTLYGVPLTILRFFTVYGPRQRPDMAIYKFTRAITRGEPVRLFGNGESSRDYTYVTDIVDGIEKSMSASDKGCQIFNLGSGRPVTLKHLIETIERCVNKKAKIEFLPEQPGDVDVTLADISKAKNMLGYNPRTTIEDGISFFVQWYRSNYDQIKGLSRRRGSIAPRMIVDQSSIR